VKTSTTTTMMTMERLANANSKSLLGKIGATLTGAASHLSFYGSGINAPYPHTAARITKSIQNAHSRALATTKSRNAATRFEVFNSAGYTR